MQSLSSTPKCTIIALLLFYRQNDNVKAPFMSATSPLLNYSHVNFSFRLFLQAIHLPLLLSSHELTSAQVFCHPPSLGLKAG